MAFRQQADTHDLRVADSFPGIHESPLDEWRPMLFLNWTQGIVSAGAVERPLLIQEHLGDQVLAAAEENVSDVLLVLDGAAQAALYRIAAIFQELLELIENNDHLAVGA